MLLGLGILCCFHKVRAFEPSLVHVFSHESALFHHVVIHPTIHALLPPLPLLLGTNAGLLVLPTGVAELLRWC